MTEVGLPEADAGIREAVGLGGALGLTSAALHHGWSVAHVPERPHVIISRGRRLPQDARRRAYVHWAELGREQVRGGVTTESVTLSHCLRRLPYTEALSVADSALREGFGEQNLLRLAEQARGPGSAQVREVSARASRLAANPFESTLRGISHSVAGLALQPQVKITDGAWPATPDLVDPRLRIVGEADSFQFHGHRSALATLEAVVAHAELLNEGLLRAAG